MLVLAGPGSGKTRVLTCRIARLLDSSRDQRFRVLALTFTNKAANEMSGRVTALVPGLEGRTSIDTFHGFCAQVLRQHGVHLGIKPDFAIYSLTADRQAVLEDALGRDHAHNAAPRQHEAPAVGGPPEDTARDATTGRTVDDRDEQGASRGRLSCPLTPIAVTKRNCASSTHWISTRSSSRRIASSATRPWLASTKGPTATGSSTSFQDTNGAQYALLRRMAGPGFS